MITQLNDVLRTGMPSVHRWMKRLATGWMNSPSPAIPAMRTLGGSRVRVHPRFLNFDFASIEPQVVRWIDTHLTTGSVALDIGANVGFLSMLMARRAGAHGRVFAFEPAEANLDLLRYHVRKNALAQVEIVPSAVSDEHGGEISFFLLHGGDSPSNSLTFGRDQVPNLAAAEAASRREVRVNRVSVDGFCREHRIRPSLLKIDVEGAELMVLRGASRTLAEDRPAVIVAVHPWWMPPGQKPEDITAFLHERGYTFRDAHGANVEVPDYGEYIALPATADA